MKKLLAVVLALVLALSCTVIAFAADDPKCPYCGATFANEDLYNEHISICYDQHNKFNEDFANFSAKQLVDSLMDIFSANSGWLKAVETILVRIMDLIENITIGAIDKETGKADVAGAIDELEAKIATLPIVGDALEYIHNLINTLRQKIKDLYSNSAETGAVAPVDTGSDASIGIVAFATVSVAAAAAFVCTRKKNENEED